MPTEYCRHIRLNGTRCRSYALHGQPRCFWHNSLQQRHLALAAPPSEIPAEYADPEYLATHPLTASYFAQRPLELNLPEIEDRSSIQLALSMLLNALARNLIDPKRATPLIYGLQVASSNVRDFQETYVVRSSSIDEHGQPLAPDEDPQEIIEAELFMQDFEADQKRLQEDPDYESQFEDGKYDDET
jgi:hypothetical protein